jgi:hypothetical protein
VSYSALCRRVEAAEREFEASVATARSDWSALKDDTKAAMTPTRIVVGGFLSGFLLGLSAPLARIGGSARVVQFASSMLSLLGSLQAREAAAQAQDAAETATDVAQDSEAAAEQVVEAVEDIRP